MASAATAGISLAQLHVQVITAQPTPRSRGRLRTSRRDQRLLVLDPFVRSRIDESLSGAVAPLLALSACTKATPRHSRGRQSGAIRAGQALRGSSEFHPGGDSNPDLRRYGDPFAYWERGERWFAVADANFWHPWRVCRVIAQAYNATIRRSWKGPYLDAPSLLFAVTYVIATRTVTACRLSDCHACRDQREKALL
jgi:hypothetical protein